MRVAIMQPYLYPYMNYFRLIDRVDLFILFDCVQFPRRGRVHRAPLSTGGWLTLPLAKQPREVLIRDLALSASRDADWAERLGTVPGLSGEMAEELAPPLPEPALPWLEARLRGACDRLGITTPFAHSSSYAIPAELRAQDRVLAVARAAGATRYLNLPGGRALYDPATFADAGIALEFLDDYPGPWFHMLEALAREPAELLRDDL
ncbi:WbqC family protein [Pseudoroseicyclus sp. H15]